MPWSTTAIRFASRLAQTGLFDHFLRIINENIDPDAEETRQERFEFGLDCVLEGIAVTIARKTS